jgi:hypothetical protein
VSGAARAALSIAALAALAGCAQLKRDRCDSDMDCPSRRCDLQRHRCLPADGGLPGGGGSDGGRTDGQATDGGSTDAGDGSVDRPPPPCSVDANDCGGSTPFCDPGTHMCRGCLSDPECSGLSASTPGCRQTEADLPGECVACTKNAHCTSNQAPVCNGAAGTCTGCATDGDCARFPPGICKTFFAAPSDAGAPLPAACATPEQAIYVQATAGCSDTPDGGVGGTAETPFCSMQPVLGAIAKDRNIVIVTGGVSAGTWTYADQASGKLLIIGRTTPQQPAAKIASTSAPAFAMSSGDVTIRNLSFTSNLSPPCIQATGGTLTLGHVVVDSCMGGGILLNGAAFDVENTTLTNDGPTQTGPVSWGAIYVAALPPAGKPAVLNQVTLLNDPPVAVACIDKVDGRNIAVSLMPGTLAFQSSCGITACGPADAGSTCGAQP